MLAPEHRSAWEGDVSGYGDFYENRVTGERCVILRTGMEDEASPTTSLVHLTAPPGSAVVGEHVHPTVTERFVVVSGTLGMRLDGEESQLVAGEEATAPAGSAHDWWNAGDDVASVIVELDPPTERFETMIATLFGLANAGRTNAKGLPNPLQLALIGQQFDDVLVFTKPPRAVQRIAFALLAPIARARGLRPTYDEYLAPHGHTEPDPAALAAAGLAAAPTR
ncbi:MAG: cupin domain-containing protein [Solirubrobacteraceae bacterium]|nr:cupin domain-containing protein [Solirubrobacteraceae bacterium]